MPDSDRIEAGLDLLQTYFGKRPDKDTAAVKGDFFDITMGNLFGDIWQRGGLELRERSMITLAALIALGRYDELKIHLHGASNIGITEETIREMIIHLAHYGGWPVGVSSMRVADDFFEKKAKNAT